MIRAGFQRARRAALALAALLALAAGAAAEDAQALFAQGYELYKGGLYKGAIALFQQGLDGDPGNGLAHFYLAESHYKLGQLQPALEHYRQSIDLLPEGDDQTRARNLAVAIEAELGAGSSAGTNAGSGSASTATTSGGTVDWAALVGQDAGVSKAIMEFYNTTHPVNYAPKSQILGIYNMLLESASPAGATVAFKCMVANPGDTGKLYRARAALEPDGSSFKVVTFTPREKFTLEKLGAF